MSNYTRKDCEGSDMELHITGMPYLPGNPETPKAFIRRKKCPGKDAKKFPKTANKCRVV